MLMSQVFCISYCCNTSHFWKSGKVKGDIFCLSTLIEKDQFVHFTLFSCKFLILHELFAVVWYSQEKVRRVRDVQRGGECVVKPMARKETI